jgi:hypothetical protein
MRWRGLDSPGSGQEPVASFCEYGDEPSVYIIGTEFLDYLSDY